MKNLSEADFDRVTSANQPPVRVVIQEAFPGLFKRAELWGGRLAMVSFAAVMVAIAVRATI
ncbi:MAG: hypothetical protein VKK04_10605 [Synechococcales bacterium]|nr:hypothetical protein [Synechococcales bacterium]